MSLILGLWSIVLEPGKTYSQSTNPAIQITNISYGAEVKGDARSVVSIKYPEFEQDSDDEDEESDSEKEVDEDEDEEDDDSPIKLPTLITKEAVIAILKPNQTEQVSVNISLVEDTEVVEFSVTGPNPVHLIGNYIRQEDFDQEPYSDEEDNSEFDSEDEDIPSDFDEDDEDLEGLSGLIDGEDSEEEMDEDRFEEVKEEKKAPAANLKKRAAEEEAKVSSDGAETLSKNQKKKLAKKLKGDDGKAAAPAAAAAPIAAPKEEAAAPKKAPSKTQTLPGGLVITDAKIGDGPVAKSGSKVGMRYIGKLDSGKIFDSNTKGTPLSFTLGRGQVVSGWDKGIPGMRVGGERKLVIPASMAYGKKGTQGIPPNSTLTFDVKLVSCK